MFLLQIDPAVGSSLYKARKTYNLRLKENVLHMKLRVPPTQATWLQWVKTLQKKKKLTWFAENDAERERLEKLEI